MLSSISNISEKELEEIQKISSNKKIGENFSILIFQNYNIINRL